MHTRPSTHLMTACTHKTLCFANLTLVFQGPQNKEDVSTTQFTSALSNL